jgi:HSP20 family protein
LYSISPARAGFQEERQMAIERWRPFGGLSERWDPFRHVADIQGEMNRLFDALSARPAASERGGRTWLPFVDIVETKDDLVLKFDLPGIREKDVQLSITGDLLTVRGERAFEADAKEQTYHHVERVYGKFERAIQLPMPVQADKVKATYREGVLEVTLPKTEEVKPKQIRIDIL